MTIERRECVNCGKPLPPSLVCVCCGTDYNEKPKCEHFYTEWIFEPNPKECAGIFMFKCGKCGEVIKLNCSERMCQDIFRRLV
jgi:hypothetical protein